MYYHFEQDSCNGQGVDGVEPRVRPARGGGRGEVGGGGEGAHRRVRRREARGVEEGVGLAVAGRQFNRKVSGLSFGFKNGLRFHFGSETCLNYPCWDIFSV